MNILYKPYLSYASNNIIVWQCDPVNFCHEFGIKKLLTILNIMTVINFIIMGVSLH